MKIKNLKIVNESEFYKDLKSFFGSSKETLESLRYYKSLKPDDVIDLIGIYSKSITFDYVDDDEYIEYTPPICIPYVYYDEESDRIDDDTPSALWYNNLPNEQKEFVKELSNIFSPPAIG